MSVTHSHGGLTNRSAGASSCCGIPGSAHREALEPPAASAIARAREADKPIIWLIRIISRLVRPTSSSWLREGRYDGGETSELTSVLVICARRRLLARRVRPRQAPGRRHSGYTAAGRP